MDFAPSLWNLHSGKPSWGVFGLSVFVLSLLSLCPSTGVDVSLLLCKCCSFSGSGSSSQSSLDSIRRKNTKLNSEHERLASLPEILLKSLQIMCNHFFLSLSNITTIDDIEVMSLISFSGNFVSFSKLGVVYLCG